MARSLLFIGLLVALLPTAISARTWHILPDGTGDAATIKAGVESAASGDTLLLADGVFTGAGSNNIVISAKSLLIRSESGHPIACVIDCGGSGTCIAFSAWRAQDFASGTVAYVKITSAQTAILASGYASASVRHCVLSGNTGPVIETGGVTGMGYGSAGMTDCIFSSNGSVAIRCGFKCTTGASGCIFYQNQGVIEVSNMGWGSLSECTLYANSGGSSGVLRITGTMAGSISLTRSIVASNSGQTVACGVGGIDLECSDIWGNAGGDYVGCISGQSGVNGNFSANPLLCDPTHGDFGLQLNSPCAPGSHPTGADCGTIGARGPECGHATEVSTWGRIKAQFGR